MSTSDRVYPSVGEIREHLLLKENEGKNIIPIVKDLSGDLETPVSAFLKVRRGDHSFLLESVVGGENRGRYSFIGTEPFKVMTVDNEGDPLRKLEEEMKKYKHVDMPSLSVPPFTGGGVGFVTYDCVRHFEPRTAPFIDKQSDPLDIPESMWMFVDSVVIFDHVKHIVKVVAHVRYMDMYPSVVSSLHLLCNPTHTHTIYSYTILPDSFTIRLDLHPSLEDAYSAALLRINEIERRLETPISNETIGREPTKEMFEASCSHVQKDFDWNESSNTGQVKYEEFVGELKKNIVLGNIIQAVPSQRIHKKLPPYQSPFDIYRQLRMVNPSPYMFYVEAGEDTQIVGASPEMLVKVDHERVVYTHPIAGTRKRGKDAKEDAFLAADLLADTKERAEHIMLVDLGRNDVGRVAKPGTVKVDALMVIEKYSHVQHIVSKVSGVLEDDKTIYDAFRAIFPAGTVSGAPKVKAIELVASLEPERRYLYAGAVGYVSFDGVLDTAIAIRTIVIHKQVIYMQAGAGIVYDSVPNLEYEETVNKLMGAMRAVDSSEEGRRAAVLKYYKTS